MNLYLLVAFLPGRHLSVLVFVIGCIVSVLDNIYMYSLCLLSVIVVSSPKKSDRWAVMKHTVYLWQVEMVANAEIHEDILIIVKSSEGVVQACERRCRMGWQLSQKQEVKDGLYNRDDLSW